MTRINVIPVEELSDAWLLAEYRELPRVIKQDINIDDIKEGEAYRLVKSHVKWAKKHSWFTFNRYYHICEEMVKRGFKVNYSYESLLDYVIETGLIDSENFRLDYKPVHYDINLNRQRLIERYNANPKAPRWTGCNTPEG